MHKEEISQPKKVSYKVELKFNISLVFPFKMGRLKYFVILICVMCSDTFGRSIKRDVDFSRKYDLKDELNSLSKDTLKRTERQANNGGRCRVRRCNQVRFMR